MGEKATEHGDLYRPLVETLHEQIASNPDALFAGEIQGKPMHGVHPATVELLVAPAAPLYDPEALNDFMDRLVDVSPSHRISAGHSEGKKGHVALGKLCFDEVVGKKRVQTMTHTEVVDRQALAEIGINEGEQSEERVSNIHRRIWLRVYPTIGLAKTVLSYESKRAADNNFPRDPELNSLHYSFSPSELRAIETGGSRSYRLREGINRFLNGGHSH